MYVCKYVFVNNKKVCVHSYLLANGPITINVIIATTPLARSIIPKYSVASSLVML